MRKAAATAIAVVLLTIEIAPTSHADTTAWEIAHLSPRTAASTRFDTLLVENESIRMVELKTDMAVRKVGGWQLDVRNVTKKATNLDSNGLPVTSQPDSAVLESDWVTYPALWPLHKGGAEAFFTAGPEAKQPGAFEPRSEGPANFEEIQLRVVVKLVKLPNILKPSKRVGLHSGERTLVIASAQFVGGPYDPDGVFDPYVELRSTGLLEGAIFEHLRAQLADR